MPPPPDAPAVFDAHLHPGGLPEADLESLALFGVTAAVAAPLPGSSRTAPALIEGLEGVIHRQLERLERAGIRGYAMVGLHARDLPRRGLPEILQALPALFQGGRVVALGPLGLKEGGGLEEDALKEQLLLARRLNLAALVQGPLAGGALLRRTLKLVHEAELSPERAVFTQIPEGALPSALALGHVALTLHPDSLDVPSAVALVRAHGSRRLLLASRSGLGSGDLLALPRLMGRLKKERLPEGLLTQLGHRNAAAFFNVT